MAAFSIEPLAPSHPRKEFDSGVPVLDRSLAERASQDVRRRVGNCFVALDAAGTIAGYYTFAATGIPLSALPPDEAKRLPHYTLMPAGLIGRLAVARQYRGRGLSGALVIDAVKRSAHSDPAIFALMVDAKNDQAVAFYRHLGFGQFRDRPLSLYLPIATALKALGVQA